VEVVPALGLAESLPGSLGFEVSSAAVTLGLIAHIRIQISHNGLQTGHFLRFAILSNGGIYGSFDLIQDDCFLDLRGFGHGLIP
jgi:hypothetical protein